MADKKLSFAREITHASAPIAPTRPWKILLVDDDPEVHAVTELILKEFTFEDQPLQFLKAFSAGEAREILSETPNIALAMIDVVMETDNAGLDLIHWIRCTLGNDKIRLVLRTGQPGQAPEHRVIRDYDINDYKDKTELTDTKMNTLLYSTLRSYRDIITIDRTRAGLERVINASTVINKSHSLERFSTRVLGQLERLLGSDPDSPNQAMDALAVSHTADNEYQILALSDSLKHAVNQGEEYTLPTSIKSGLDKARETEKSTFDTKQYFGYYRTEQGKGHLLYINSNCSLDPLNGHLLDLYSTNVGITFENIHLKEEIQETQKELIYILGEAVEKRSKETGGHVKRVAKVSHALALKYGLPEVTAERIKYASPLHDVGKIGIPDHILNKPGKLTPEEWTIMKSHSQIGHDILIASEKPIIKMGAEICISHHENWNGSGYPNGLAGEQIPIAGRITAVADVFDALGSERCYKKAWPIEEIIAEMTRLSGIKFEPRLIQLLLDNLEEFLQFRQEFPD